MVFLFRYNTIIVKTLFVICLYRTQEIGSQNKNWKSNNTHLVFLIKYLYRNSTSKCTTVCEEDILFILVLCHNFFSHLF